MSLAKEKSYLLKDRAKELGYELKLTHCQELIAKLEGFNNRHSLLVNDKNNINLKDNLINKIKKFINENNVKNNEKIVKELFSNEKLELIQKTIDNNIERTLNELLVESLTTIKFYEFTDESDQTDCIAAFNYKQALGYMTDTYGSEISSFKSIEVSEEYIKNLKMFKDDTYKGKKVSAYSILEQELKEGEKLPLVLYCNWL